MYNRCKRLLSMFILATYGIGCAAHIPTDRLVSVMEAAMPWNGIHLGVNGESIERLTEAAGTVLPELGINVLVVEVDYTLLDQSVAETTIPLAEKHDVGLILGSVLGMGKLGGREPKDDPRAHAMWQWCRDRGVSIRHLAMQFCMALPLKNGIIMPGPGTKEHVEEVYEAATTELPPEMWSAFRAEFGVG